MNDIYTPKTPPPKLSNENFGHYTMSATYCRVNAQNWRLCAANAADRADWNEVERCQAKARKIAGWLDDLMEVD